MILKFGVIEVTWRTRIGTDYTHLQLNLDKRQFQACFITLGPCRNAIKNLRLFFAADGTHTRSRYRMILLLLVGLGANEKVIPLAWALVPGENITWWNYFLGHCKKAFPILSDEESKAMLVFISDRDKRIKDAVESVFPLAKHAHCCQHIAENIRVQ